MDAEPRRTELQSQLLALREAMRQRPSEQLDAALNGVARELRELDRARDEALVRELPTDASDPLSVNYPRASVRLSHGSSRRYAGPRHFRRAP